MTLFKDFDYDLVRMIAEGIGQEQFDRLMQTKKGLHAVFRYGTPDIRSAVYEKYQDKIPALIKTAQDFNDLSMGCNMSQRASLLGKLGPDRIADIIVSSIDLLIIREYSMSSINPPISVDLENKIIKIVKTIDDLSAVITFFPPDARQRVFNELKDKIPAMIKNSMDFDKALEVFSSLTDIQINKLLIGMQDKLGAIISGESQLLHYVRSLSKNNCEILINAFIKKAPTFFDTDRQFISMDALGELSKKISTDQFKTLLSTLINHKVMIDTFYNKKRSTGNYSIQQCLEILDPPTRLVFLTQAWPTLSPKLIIPVYDRRNKASVGWERESYNLAMNLFYRSNGRLGLSPEESGALFKGFPVECQESEYIKPYLEQVHPIKRADTIIAIVNSNPSIIKKVDDFKVLFDDLEPEQLAKTVRSLSDVISQKIEGRLDYLKTFLSSLSAAQRTIVLDTMMDKITPLIKTKADLKFLGTYFSTIELESNRYVKLLSTVFAIAEQSVKADDRLLSDYVDHAIASIREVKSTSDVDELQSRLSATLQSVNSTEVRAVRQYLGTLIQKAAQCGIINGPIYRKKVTDITDALSKMSPDSRGTVLTGASNPVQMAIKTRAFSKTQKPSILEKVKKIEAELRGAPGVETQSSDMDRASRPKI